MIEMITVFFGLFSAGIFLAHAFDGYRFEGLTKGSATMRNHDSRGNRSQPYAALLRPTRYRICLNRPAPSRRLK
jgi:hypothetical protein